MTGELDRALAGFDAAGFVRAHGGYKESRSSHSHEYLLRCPCGSFRLRWRHEPGVKQAWVCWGCRKTGDTVDLIQLLDGVDRLTAIDRVIDGYQGGDAPTQIQARLRTSSAARTQLELLTRIMLPRGAAPIMAGQPAFTQAWAYLERRGLSRAEVLEYKLAFGLGGRLKGYVVFPLYMDGAMVYWQARAAWDPPEGLSESQRRAWTKATNYRKTLNPANSEVGCSASDVLYNYDRAACEPHVVVVEGPIDAIKVGPHAVALFGKALSDAKLARLQRMRARRYTVYLDRGEQEYQVAMRLAAELEQYAPTDLAVPPEGYDAGALTRAQNAAVIAGAQRYRGRVLSSPLRA